MSPILLSLGLRKGTTFVPPSPPSDEIELFEQFTPSGRLMAVQLASSSRNAWTLDAAGTPSDAEVLVRGLIADASSDNNFRAHLCVSGSTGAENMYGIDLISGGLRLIKYANSTSTTIATSMLFTWGVGQWFWVRFRKSGTSLKAKAWLEGDDEPLDWMIDETDTSLTSGAVGWGKFASGRAYLANIGIGVNGATAPSNGSNLNADQFYEDFFGADLGPSPDGWTSWWAATAPEVIEAPAAGAQNVPPLGWRQLWAAGSWLPDADSYLGSTSLKAVGSPSGRRSLAWAEKGIITSPFYEALMLAKSSGTGDNQLRLYLRAGGGASSEQAVYIELEDSGVSLGTYGGTLLQSAGVPYVADQWYWFRFREEGDTFKGRVWPAGEKEPRYWMVEGDEVAVPAGYLALGFFEASGEKRFDYFAYNSIGQTIALPPGEPDGVDISPVFSDIGEPTTSNNNANQYANEFTPSENLVLRGVELRGSPSASPASRTIFVWRVEDQTLLAQAVGTRDAREATPNFLAAPVLLEAGKAYRIGYRSSNSITHQHTYDGFTVDPRFTVGTTTYFSGTSSFPDSASGFDMRGAINPLFED